MTCSKTLESQKKVEIYGTLGPACSDYETLRKMFAEGMTGMRVNLSHTDLPTVAESLRMVQAAAAECGIVPKLVMDMQGPELRLGDVPEGFALTVGETIKEDLLPFPEIVKNALVPGQQILLDDGKLLLEVQQSLTGMVQQPRTGMARSEQIPGEARQPHSIDVLQPHTLKVLRGGPLKSRKSIALPGLCFRQPTLTEKDKENIAVAKSLGITGLMQPFVRDREDLETVRKALDSVGAEKIEIFAKIENQTGLDHLEELIPACDEIVIARGDLGNAMPLWKLPAAQKYICQKCRKAGRRFMVVTQMLASMETNAVPTRAEVSDIFNAVLDGAASVMVTGETAAGRYPVETMRYLSKTAAEAVKYII